MSKVIFIIENPYHDIVEYAQSCKNKTVKIFQNVSYDYWHSLSLKQYHQNYDFSGSKSNQETFTYQDYVSGDTVIRVDTGTNIKTAFKQQSTKYVCGNDEIDLIEVVETIPLHKIYPSMTYQTVYEYRVWKFGPTTLLSVYEIVDMKNPISGIKYAVSIELPGYQITNDLMESIFYTPTDAGKTEAPDSVKSTDGVKNTSGTSGPRFWVKTEKTLSRSQ